MTTGRAVSIGLLVWLFALYLFFFVLGGFGLFGRSPVEAPIKRGVPMMQHDPSDPFADNDLEARDVEARYEAERSSSEFRRWATQSQMRNATHPTTPRGTRPQPMTPLGPGY